MGCSREGAARRIAVMHRRPHTQLGLLAMGQATAEAARHMVTQPYRLPRPVPRRTSQDAAVSGPLRELRAGACIKPERHCDLKAPLAVDSDRVVGWRSGTISERSRRRTVP